MTTRLMSPRKTLPNQMLDCSPTCVSPITRAVSAMNTPGPICGRRPRYSRTLPTMRILAMYVAKCKADLARFGEPHGTRKANAAEMDCRPTGKRHELVARREQRGHLLGRTRSWTARSAPGRLPG